MQSKPFAKKSLGQNFLSDPNYVRKIVEAVRHRSGSGGILEIGPGRGAITEHLKALNSPLVVVEKDCDLAEQLAIPETADLVDSLRVVNGDFLELDLPSVLSKENRPFTAVGNLPYNVASPILIKLLKHHALFSEFFLMFQKEVAVRMTAKPGTRDYSLLTVWTEMFAEAKILFDLPPTVFRPQPKVKSSFVHFKLLRRPVLKEEEVEPFFDFASKLFQKRRKTLASTFKTMGLAFPSDLDLNLRAESLTVSELAALFRRVVAF